MSTGYTILVSGLAPETTESKLQDFFSFCGKTISVAKSGASTATISFERESAAKTALMLNGGTLDGAHLEVTSPATTLASATTTTAAAPVAGLPVGATDATPIGEAEEDGHPRQEDKPRAAIVAEYLAHGYTLADHIIDRFLDMDRKQGISSKFLNFMNKLDTEVGTRVAGPDAKVSGVVASPIQQAFTHTYSKAKEVDQNRGISEKFLQSYTKAANTPIGQKIFKFYTETTKQIMDVHEEARRITDEKKVAAGGTQPAAAEVAPTVTEKVDAVTAPAV